MTAITERGRKLATYLYPEGPVGAMWDAMPACSLITRHAVTYSHIQERWCSDEMSDRATAALERREAQIEGRIRTLVASLPPTPDGPFGVNFGGDPRGFTVKITAPGESARNLRGQSWGLDGTGADF